MTTEETELRARDGEKLFCRRFGPAGDARSTIVLVHGLGEHSGRYGHVVQRFVERGLEVVTYDHRGHGLSGGRRGDSPSFEAFLEDLSQVVAFSESTPFLYGHSFGGLVTVRFLQQRRAAVRGAIVASPLLRLVFEPPRWKLLLAAVARTLWPTLTQNSGVDPAVLSRDMAFIAEGKKQDLSHRRISARLFYEFNRHAELAMAEGEKITQPLLLLHGQMDRLTSWEATKALFPSAASEDKTLKLYPETFHEAHNDLNREEILRDVLHWIEARLCVAGN